MTRTLSDDIHLVGNTLGEVLQAHGSEQLFEVVESMRAAAKAARDADDEGGRSRLEALARGLDADLARDVARAFTLYFQLINLCEDIHRVRTIRKRENAGGTVDGSLERSFQDLVRAGAKREEALAVLGETRLCYVFTAHPTEARRRTTERLLAEVTRTLSRRDIEDLAPRIVRREDRALRAAVESLWQHASERSEKPEVLDEVKAGLWYLRNVLLDVVPRMHRRAWWAFQDAYGAIDPLELPLPVAFGSWMGSDRDGNPFVTDAVTERTLELQRWIILDRYREDLQALIDPLAADEQRLVGDGSLDRALTRAAAAVPEVAREASYRNPREPLRRMLTFMTARIERTRTMESGAYPRPEAFLEDVSVLRGALIRSGAEALADDRLLDLAQRVRAFGFHLAALDVREDSEVHRAVIAELLDDPEYPSRPPSERVAALERLTLPGRDRPLSDDARRLLELWATIRRLHGRFGPEALPTYIISMTSSVADVLEVFRLAQLHDLEGDLDVAPLLETPNDLAEAKPILSALFADEPYRRHLNARGGTQELLVGYSDSMKRGGILASRAAVLEAQRAAAGVCRDSGVRLRVFHGRGGSVSRGGGPTHRAIEALPREAFSGDMKITEQGEMRAANFANPDVATRYLEQTVGAALVSRHGARQDDKSGPVPPVLAELADISRRKYEELVAKDDLVTYFREATPFEEIANLRIGSRPTKRRGQTKGIGDLRAIPWVFSWSQSRHVITGWYGVGTALEAADPEQVRALLSDSRFFRDLLDNVEMAMAKSELGIAQRYAALCTNDGVREAIYGDIAAEFERTRRAVLAVTGRKALLDADPWLQRSIELRNPYVDPLSYLQVEALRRVRAGEQSWGEVARVAVQGIAAGVRITG